MPELVPTLVITVIVLAVLAALWWAWRSRSARSRHLTTKADVSRFGGVAASFDVQYVATTERGEPLQRLAIKGLAFRGPATIQLLQHGVTFAVKGEGLVAVAASELVSVDLATWTIDRAVERDGLVVVTWTISDREVDSYFRITDLDERDQLVAGLSQIVAGNNPGVNTTRVED